MQAPTYIIIGEPIRAIRRGVRLFTVFAVFMLLSPPAHANENFYICAKNLETREMYHAMASNASGLDLNTASHSSAYDATQNYVVVLWEQNHFSIIRMQPPVSVPSYFPSPGMDQDGHMWEVSLYSQQTCP